MAQPRPGASLRRYPGLASAGADVIARPDLLSCNADFTSCKAGESRKLTLCISLHLDILPPAGKQLRRGTSTVVQMHMEAKVPQAPARARSPHDFPHRQDCQKRARLRCTSHRSRIRLDIRGSQTLMADRMPCAYSIHGNATAICTKIKPPSGRVSRTCKSPVDSSPA